MEISGNFRKLPRSVLGFHCHGKFNGSGISNVATVRLRGTSPPRSAVPSSACNYYNMFSAFNYSSQPSPLVIACLIFLREFKQWLQHFLAKKEFSWMQSYATCYSCTSDTTESSGPQLAFMTELCVIARAMNQETAAMRSSGVMVPKYSHPRVSEITQFNQFEQLVKSVAGDNGYKPNAAN